jgi:hypothetical protein
LRLRRSLVLWLRRCGSGRYGDFALGRAADREARECSPPAADADDEEVKLD